MFTSRDFLRVEYNVLTANQKRHYLKSYNNIQLVTFNEVNTRIGQPMEHDIHRGIRASNLSATSGRDLIFFNNKNPHKTEQTKESWINAYYIYLKLSNNIYK